MTDPQSTATATLRCPDDCFSIEYRATTSGDQETPSEFLNRMGPPAEVQRGGGRCPNCNAGLTVDGPEGADG